MSSEKTRSAPAEFGVMANCTGRRHGGDGAGGSIVREDTDVEVVREDADAEVEAATRARG